MELFQTRSVLLPERMAIGYGLAVHTSKNIDAEKTDMGSYGKPPGQSMTDEKKDAAKPDARVDANVRAHLGRKLKTAYQALVEEPVPDRFAKLLEELRSKEGKS